MPILKIARMGHPVLLEQAVAVTDIASVQDLIQDMAETLIDSGGIGLAAPQVHASDRVILISVPAGRTERKTSVNGTAKRQNAADYT